VPRPHHTHQSRTPPSVYPVTLTPLHPPSRAPMETMLDLRPVPHPRRRPGTKGRALGLGTARLPCLCQPRPFRRRPRWQRWQPHWQLLVPALEGPLPPGPPCPASPSPAFATCASWDKGPLGRWRSECGTTPQWLSRPTAWVPGTLPPWRPRCACMRCCGTALTPMLCR